MSFKDIPRKCESSNTLYKKIVDYNNADRKLTTLQQACMQARMQADMQGVLT